MRTPFAVAIVLLAGCAGAPGAAPDAAPAGPAAAPEDLGYQPNLWLLDGFHPPSVTVSEGAEPSILADRDGQALWIGDTAGFHASTDNGTSWRENSALLLPGGFTDGWSVAQDDAGTVYTTTTNGLTVDVARSRDKGRTWDPVVAYATSAWALADRPWLAAHGDGDVALFLYNIPYEACHHSTDGGATWVDRSPISGSPQGGNAVYDDAGNFYYANDAAEVTKFTGSCLLGMQRKTMIDGLGANNMIQIDVDGPDLYMAAATDGNRRVVLAGSRDFGTPKTLAVSPPFLQSNTFVTVAAQGGRVAVGWYGSETGGDPSQQGFNGAFNVYVAFVDGFWTDSPRVAYLRATAEANHVGDICMGGISCSDSADRDLLDYWMMDYDLWGGLHLAYGHDGAGSDSRVRYAGVPAGVADALLDGLPLPLDLAEDPGVPAADGVSPTASFTAKARGYSVGVDGTASADPQGSPLSYAWTWGDGASGTGPRANHTYARHGAFAITLKVTDADGHVGQASRNLLVDGSGDQPPMPRISVSPAQPVAGQAVTLRDASTDADGRVVAREWTIGSKRWSEATVQLKFAAGTHTVKLAVTDDVGVSASTSVALKVQPAPDADGDGTPDPVGDGAITVKVPGLGLAAAVAAAAAGFALAARRGTRRP